MTAVSGPAPPDHEAPDHEASAPTGYTVVLPPGWSRIPLRRGTEQAITKILDRSFAGLPRDQVATLRHELRLQQLATSARENCGLDLYLPTERMHGVTVAASFVVAEMSLSSVQDVDPALLIARLIADNGHTTAVDLAGTAGTRTEHAAAADAERGVEHGSRRVDYVLPVPTEHLGEGLRTMRYCPFDPGPDHPPEPGALYAGLNYAWRVDEHDTDVRLSTACPDLARLIQIIDDVDALARGIRIV